jgi:hypothetical protein
MMSWERADVSSAAKHTNFHDCGKLARNPASIHDGAQIESAIKSGAGGASKKVFDWPRDADRAITRMTDR